MTYAPATLTALMAYLGTQGVVNLGIVGSATHTRGYHLGKDRIFGTGGLGLLDYSVKLARDRNGLTNAASGVDLGKVNGSLAGLQHLTAWLWAECQKEAADTRTIREVLGTVDGKTVRCWISREAGGPKMLDNCADLTHLTHTHISYFRDTETTDKRPLFRRYFDEQESDMLLLKNFKAVHNRKVTLIEGASLWAEPDVSKAKIFTYKAGTEFFPDFVGQGVPVNGTDQWYAGWGGAPAGQPFSIQVGYIHTTNASAEEPVEAGGTAAYNAGVEAAAAKATEAKK